MNHHRIEIVCDLCTANNIVEALLAERSARQTPSHFQTASSHTAKYEERAPSASRPYARTT
jgi:hypothetical protein